MKYFSIDTVVEACQGFQGCMTNKSWGYLALLKGCQDSIRPSVLYRVDMDVVSNFLEDIFNLSQSKKSYKGGRSLNVVFSNKWDSYFKQQGKLAPNIYDVIAWAYRRTPFADDITNEKVLRRFSEEFNMPIDVIANSFDTTAKRLDFSNYLYSEFQLKAELSKIGVDVSKENIDAKKGGVVASPGEINRSPFIQTLYAGLEITDYVIILQSDYYSLYGDIKQSVANKVDDNSPRQQIVYGAPGTGKSWKIKCDAMVKSAEAKNLVFRTTFHPDSDYSTFVGAYKPTMRAVADKYKAVAGKDDEITYAFVPQVFLQAYVAAWNNLDEPVFLVIEEINRGNCAQIFGDLFQLLDRDDTGWSEYPIRADADLTRYLVSGKDDNGQDVLQNKDGIKDRKMRLPRNLYIWATMNTSDQSLFPIDSAFKRRWDWTYMPIEDAGKGWKIDVNHHEYDWYSFLESINREVLELTHSEDKQLGYFFAKAKDGKIDATTLVNKVYFYLWTDVFKDYDFESQTAFRKADSNEPIAFGDFFRASGVNESMTEQVLINLGLPQLQEPTE